jgi:hypothetical protein
MLSLHGSVQKSYGLASSLATLETLPGALVAQLSMLAQPGQGQQVRDRRFGIRPPDGR